MDTTKCLCDALIKIGVTDPESEEAKNFCTGQTYINGTEVNNCPYVYCVIAESHSPSGRERAARKSVAQELRKQGLKLREIAKKMGVSYQTARDYCQEK